MVTCEICNREFKSEQALGLHLLKKHKNSKELPEKIVLDEAETTYLEALRKEAYFYEEKAKLEKRIRKAAEIIREPTIEEKILQIFQILNDLSIRVRRIEKELMSYASEKHHDEIMERLIKMLGE